MFEWFGLVNFAPYTKVSAFAQHLKDGHLMGTKCKACGHVTFPPRADCNECLSPDFEFIEYSGKGTLHTHTLITAPPSGFEDLAPYHVGVVDLAEGGRLLAWFGETIPSEEVAIGMEVQLVPRIFEELEPIKVYYTLEKPGTTWTKV